MSIARFAVYAVALASPLFVSSAQPRDPDSLLHTSHLSDPSSALVAQVRRATEAFRDVREAMKAEYGQFLGCVSGPQEGAMGVHFVNSSFVDDGELDVTRPEALIYEVKDRGARLVGVEFIVKAAQWHAHHEQPPVLEGQVFQYNGSPNRYGLEAFYELHVWAWRDNPRGAFVDWNPRVSCEGQ